MSIWYWIYQLESQAYEDEDTARITMIEYFERGAGAQRHDPNMGLDLLNQSRMIAQALGEKWWVQLINHWELQNLLFFKRDYSQVIEKAAKAVVEIRKPEYESFPQRVCLHEDLIYAYLGSDPVGYHDQIQSAIDYMASQVDPHIECYQCLLNLKTDFMLLSGNFDLALTRASDLVQAVENGEHGDHHLSAAYAMMCAAGFARQDWQRVKKWASLGEKAARRNNHEDNLMEALAWNAVATRQLGDEKEALRLYQAATQHAASYGPGPAKDYYDALAAYHELGGDLQKAVQVRERQLEVLEDTAQHFAECQCRLEIVRLRKALGLSVDGAAAGVRTVAGHLKDPTRMLKQLEDYLHNGMETSS